MAGIYRSEAGKQAVQRLYRLALERWPVPHRQVVVETCAGETFLIVSGEHNDLPLVLFHGSGANSSVWIRDIAQLARTFRVYAVDMIGEPGFSAASRPPLASEAYTAWLDDVWDRLRLVRPGVVGVSLGAWLAMEYALRRPARVGAMSLLSPAGVGRQNHLFHVQAALLMALGPWGIRKSLKRVAGGADVPLEAATFVETVFRHFRPRMEKVPIRTDDELARLTMPVQVILGGKDPLLRSRETQERLYRLLPHVQLKYLEHAGHLLPSQSGAIVEFLGSIMTTTRL